MPCIAIDETPIGVFVEIEGSEEHIHHAAAALGKTAADYLTASYRALYAEHCNARGVEPGDMVFGEEQAGEAGGAGPIGE